MDNGKTMTVYFISETTKRILVKFGIVGLHRKLSHKFNFVLTGLT
jgi:hypothetical protein